MGYTLKEVKEIYANMKSITESSDPIEIIEASKKLRALNEHIKKQSYLTPLDVGWVEHMELCEYLVSDNR